MLAPPAPVRSLRRSQAGQAVRFARICDGHLAGRVGVALLHAMLAEGLLTQVAGGCAVTTTGTQRLDELGIDLPADPRPGGGGLHALPPGLERKRPPPRGSSRRDADPPPPSPWMDQPPALRADSPPHPRRPGPTPRPLPPRPHQLAPPALPPDHAQPGPTSADRKGRRPAAQPGLDTSEGTKSAHCQKV